VEKSLEESYLSKWGITAELTGRPAAASLGVTYVWLQVACYVQKNSHCSARANVTELQLCNVTKSSWLHRVERISYVEHTSVKAQVAEMVSAGHCDTSTSVKAHGDPTWALPCPETEKAGGRCCDSDASCCNPPNEAITELINLEGRPLNSLCDGVVKLL